MRVIVSNGSNKFHLAPLSAELAEHGVLAGFLTAGWPTPLVRRIACRFRSHPSVARFLDREEQIPEPLIYANLTSEVIFQIGIRLRRLSEWHEQTFDRIGFWLYARKASSVLRRLRPDIYHYRACYGLQSVETAKRLGAITLCDHSIGHPAVIDYMVTHGGRWPEKPIRETQSPLQQLMWRDIGQADHLLVNSDFVRKTCVFAGIPEERIHVVYLGVDEKFLTNVPPITAETPQARTTGSLLFAGGFQKRKGVDTLAQALAGLDAPWRLTLAGGVEHGIESNPAVAELLESERVTRLGPIPRSELAGVMMQAPIFIFPSLCEGSARVIFEAMACGCYIITTPNSGSIVEDGKHGALVPPGDVEALRVAIHWALSHPREVAEAGMRNAQIVREHYRQDQYGTRVQEIYRKILAHS